MSHENKPPRDNNQYYGTRYSVPVLCWDENGLINLNLVCWDFENNGWVFASLIDGPDPMDYEIDCNVWALPPEIPIINH